MNWGQFDIRRQGQFSLSNALGHAVPLAGELGVGMEQAAIFTDIVQMLHVSCQQICWVLVCVTCEVLSIL